MTRHRAQRFALRWGGLVVAAATLTVVPSTSADADIIDFPAPVTGCVDSVAGAVGLFENVVTPAGGITLDVPGPVAQVLVEWMGEWRVNPPSFDIGLDVTGPGGNMAGTLPAILSSIDNERLDGTGPNILAFHADATALFGTGEAGSYDIDFVPPPDGNNAPQNAWWGASITVLYVDEPCGQIAQFIWKIGADYYFGGNPGVTPATTDLIVYELDEPLQKEVTATLRSSHGGADGRPITTSCRVSIIWVATGAGPAPSQTDDLVDEFGVANPALGGVEGIIDPFTPPNQPCPPPITNLPITAVRGGNVGPEFALIEMDITVPAGSTWVAFQLESPADNGGELPVFPESGSWGGAGILVIPTVGQEPAIELEKTVLDGAGGACPGVEGTDELVVTGYGNTVTYCFRVINTGDTALFPVTLDDPTLGVALEDLTVVSGDPTSPLLIGDEWVFSYESTATDDLTNVATVTGIPVDDDADPIPGLDPVDDTNDASVGVVLPEPDIALEKTVLPGAGAACPGVEGTDELVTVEPGDAVTYCFRVINTGETSLSPVVIDDATLGIATDDLTLLSGDDTVPLGPGAELVYRHETTVDVALTNVATVVGDPVDDGGDPIPGLDSVDDTNDASVDVLPPPTTAPPTTAPPTTAPPTTAPPTTAPPTTAPLTTVTLTLPLTLPVTGSDSTAPTSLAALIAMLLGGCALLVTTRRLTNRPEPLPALPDAPSLDAQVDRRRR